LSLRKVSLLSIFIFALLFVITQGSAVAEDSAGTDVYKAKCMTCHAKDGSGNTPVGKSLQSADLRSPEVQKKPDAELSESISEGKGNMACLQNSSQCGRNPLCPGLRSHSGSEERSVCQEEIRQVIRSVPRKTPAAQVRVWHGPLAAPYLT